MISWNGLRSLQASLALSSLLLPLAGCGKTSAPTADSAPINKLVEEAEPARENDSEVPGSAADPGEAHPRATENPAGQADTETGAAPIGRDVSTDAGQPIPPAPDYVYEPRVILSDAHQQTCLVGVGDAMPQLELTDAAGNAQKLPELFGQQFTVIVFWSTKNVLGREQIERLSSEVAKPFAPAGVNVVAINSGDEAEQVAAAVPLDAEIGLELLLDQSGAALASVATDHLPRTYLLDAEGRILWFDLEYSRNSVRELTNALHFYFGHGTEDDS